MPASSNPFVPRRRSNRLPGYDYTQAGAYFVTIVTANRVSRFGEIVDSHMYHSPLGQTVQREWQHLAGRFPGWIFDAFVVMPNHVHGLLILEELSMSRAQRDGSMTTPGTVPLRPYMKNDAVLPGSVGAIVRAFKSSTTLRYNRMHGMEPGPLWQRNFHEHIVRSDAELDLIYSYIQNNPAQWQQDRENPNT